MFLILLCSMSLSAHDLGISSISLEIKDGKFVVYSSYAKADFDDTISSKAPEHFAGNLPPPYVPFVIIGVWAILFLVTILTIILTKFNVL